jgi:hypothetical protein
LGKDDFSSSIFREVCLEKPPPAIIRCIRAAIEGFSNNSLFSNPMGGNLAATNWGKENSIRKRAMEHVHMAQP